MVEDPIVEEVRKVRQDYAARFNYDLRTIFMDLKAREAEYSQEGWKVVSFHPKKVKAKGGKEVKVR